MRPQRTLFFSAYQSLVFCVIVLCEAVVTATPRGAKKWSRSISLPRPLDVNCLLSSLLAMAEAVASSPTDIDPLWYRLPTRLGIHCLDALPAPVHTRTWSPLPSLPFLLPPLTVSSTLRGRLWQAAWGGCHCCTLGGHARRRLGRLAAPPPDRAAPPAAQRAGARGRMLSPRGLEMELRWATLGG